ncbi:hypothetical protein ACVWWN_003144 [Mycobacterium sp. URHB0021]|jgi:hypothetical protein
MNLPAGNWDENFVDHADSFDVERNTRGHLAFGYGVLRASTASRNYRSAGPTNERRPRFDGAAFTAPRGPGD